MAELHIKEKREFVRATLTTQIRVKTISRQEFEEAKQMPAGVPEPDSKALGPDADPAMADLKRWLVRIDEKLDLLLDKVGQSHSAAHDECLGRARNISGAGVGLVLKTRLPVGQLVLVSITVPGFSIGTLQAYGEVVRVTALGDSSDETFETSIKFLIISEKEREKLIGYAFCQRRREIRGAREENGAPGEFPQ